MAISNRRSILEGLKDVFEKIKVNTYQSELAEVKRGIFYYNEMLQRPALCYYNVEMLKLEDQEEFGRRSARQLKIIVRGFVDLHTTDDVYDPLDRLISDVEKVLENETANPYYADTYVGNAAIMEGGFQENVGWFEMEIFIQYDYDINSP
jgi:hypothetical protein